MTAVRVRRRLLGGRSARRLLLDPSDVPWTTRKAYSRWSQIEKLPTRLEITCKLSEASPLLTSFLSGPPGKAVVNLVNEDLAGSSITLPSGDANHVILFRGGVVRGGALLSGRLTNSSDSFWSTLPPAIRPSTYFISCGFDVELPPNSPLVGGTQVFLQNGTPLEWSRWPKSGWVTPADTSYPPSSPPPSTSDAPNRKFLVAPSELPADFSVYQSGTAITAPISIQVFSSFNWRDDKRVPVDYDAATKVFTLDTDVPYPFGFSRVNHQCRFRLVNHYAGLASSEYAIHPAEQAVYVAGHSDVVVAGKARLLGAASYVWFDNTTFEGFSREVFANTLTFCGFHKCTFRFIGTFQGVEHPSTVYANTVTILACSFSDVSDWCIMLNRASWNWPQEDSIIADSAFTRIAKFRLYHSAAVRFRGHQNHMSNCYVHDTDGGGCRLEGGANTVVANKFVRCINSPHADAGVIYAGRRYDWPYNVIAYNEITHTSPNLPVDAMAIYLDDSISGQIVLNNKMSHYEKTCFLRQGKDTLAIGNTVNYGSLRNSPGQYPAPPADHSDGLLAQWETSTIATAAWRDNWPEISTYRNFKSSVTDQIMYGNKIFSSSVVRDHATFLPGNRWDEPIVLSESDQNINFAGLTWL